MQGWPKRGALGRWIRSFDDTVDRWVERSRDPRLDPLFYGLSSAADHALLWIALGVESALTNGPIKLAFRRIRPPSAPPGPLPYGMHRPRTSAFPSGHATSAFMAATLLSEGSAKSGYWELAALVAASRVYVRMHHASDAVAGTLLGLAFGQIAKRLLTPSTRESHG